MTGQGCSYGWALGVHRPSQSELVFPPQNGFITDRNTRQHVMIMLFYHLDMPHLSGGVYGPFLGFFYYFSS